MTDSLTNSIFLNFVDVNAVIKFEHVDGDDSDHLCDKGCGTIADDGCHNNTADHACDECGAIISSCVDELGGRDYKCDICGSTMYVPGDLTGDKIMDTDDALYLMMSIFFSDQYPLNQKCDFNNSGSVDTDDAIYLLMAVYFPDIYPIK